MKIWRYLTKEKFIWLLADKGIFLGSASAQSDSREGIYDHTHPRKLVEAQPEKYIPGQLLSHTKIDLSTLDNLSEKIMQISRETQYISSWFAGDNESEEMWRNYASDGVAIISTDVLMSNTPQPIKIATTMGLVKYSSDNKKTEIHSPLTLKDDEFSHENEFRIIFNPQKFSTYTGYKPEKFYTSFFGDTKSSESEAMTNSIDTKQVNKAIKFIREKDYGYLFLYPLEKIITEIRINPYCTAEQKKELESIIRNAGLTIPVVKSEINK